MIGTRVASSLRSAGKKGMVSSAANVRQSYTNARGRNKPHESLLMQGTTQSGQGSLVQGLG